MPPFDTKKKMKRSSHSLGCTWGSDTWDGFSDPFLESTASESQAIDIIWDKIKKKCFNLLPSEDDRCTAVLDFIFEECNQGNYYPTNQEFFEKIMFKYRILAHDDDFVNSVKQKISENLCFEYKKETDEKPKRKKRKK